MMNDGIALVTSNEKWGKAMQTELAEIAARHTQHR